MWESLFGSAVAPAVTAGIGEAAVQTATPALTETAVDAGLTNALAGTGVNSLGQSTAGLAIDPALIGTGMNDAMFQSLGQMGQGFTNAGIQEGSNFATEAGLQGATGRGLFDGITNSGAWQALGSDQAKNIIGLGVGGFNAFNQGKGLSNANKIQKEQLAMSKDAYNRDKKSDEQRQKLVF